jgi:ribonuclease VapC
MAEVATRIARHGMPKDYVEKALDKLPVQTHAFAGKYVLLTGMLIQQTKHLGLSLGDRACLALGIAKNLPVLTADKIWTELRLPVEVRLIR